VHVEYSCDRVREKFSFVVVEIREGGMGGMLLEG
jgi:hypothetical protein